MKSAFRVIGTVLAMVVLLTGCQSGSQASKQAKHGAAYGALAGATSGFLRGLFHGDPLARAAEGAVVGGGTGAVVGGVSGSSQDRQVKNEYGAENYDAIKALIHRDYRKAKKLLAEIPPSTDLKQQTTAVWLSALVNYETANDTGLAADYQRLIKLSPGIDTVDDAKAEMRHARQELKKLRRKHGVG